MLLFCCLKQRTFSREVTRNLLIVCSEQFQSVEHVHKLFLFLPAWLARGKLTTGCYVRVPHGCHQENLQEIHHRVCQCPRRYHRLQLTARNKATFILTGTHALLQLLVVCFLPCVQSLNRGESFCLEVLRNVVSSVLTIFISVCISSGYNSHRFLA